MSTQRWKGRMSFFNLVRKAVSGDRRRFKEGDFDLDLSYVTNRLVAMGFPGSGLEGTYRNNIDSVSRFLNKRHGSNYMVFNLSDRAYDNSKFNHQVVECGFLDHHPPPLKMLFEICHRIHVWLSIDPEHVAVVHCLAGKGRTGIVISSYLLYARLSNSIWQGLFHFAVQRSEREEGVTMPSQIRYAYLFSEVISGDLKIHPRPMILKEIVMSGSFMPRFERVGFCPLLFIYSGRKLIHSSAWRNGEQMPYVTQAPGQKFTHPCRCLVFGDITIHMYHEPIASLPLPLRKQKTIAFRCTLHTSFLEQSAVQFDEVPENLKAPAMTKRRSLSNVLGSRDNILSPEDSRGASQAQNDRPETSDDAVDTAKYQVGNFAEFSAANRDFNVKPSFRNSVSLSNSTTQIGWKEIRVQLLKDDLDGPHLDHENARFAEDFAVEFVFDCPMSSIIDQKSPDQSTQSMIQRRDMELEHSIMIDQQFKNIPLQSYIDDISKFWRRSENLIVEALNLPVPLVSTSLRMSQFFSTELLESIRDEAEPSELPPRPQSASLPVATSEYETSKTATPPQSPSSRLPRTIEATNSHEALSPSTETATMETPSFPIGGYNGAMLSTRKTVDFASSDAFPSSSANCTSFQCQNTILHLIERMQLLQMENERLRELLGHHNETPTSLAPKDTTTASRRVRSYSSGRT